VLHLYQNTVNGYLLFYTRSDFLVFYSLLSTLVGKHGIHLMALCLMPDHLHALLDADDMSSLSEFVREYSSRFARCQNKWLGRKGPLFNPRFGVAMKLGHKAIRTSISYLYNNPVEKKICEMAEDYRWSFLPCAGGLHPFSAPLVIRRSSPALRRAVREIRTERRACHPLSYSLLDRLFRTLNPQETEQLTDWVITLYSFIDHEDMLSYYGCYEAALAAMNANTGSEYEIKEDWDVRSDAPYVTIERLLLQETGFAAVEEVLRLPEGRRRNLLARVLRRNVAPRRLVEKYLRLQPGTKKVFSGSDCK
jgi:REP element-mobilizing transposase RayT